MVAAARIADQRQTPSFAASISVRPALTLVPAAPHQEGARRLRCRWEYSQTERRLIQRWETVTA